MRYIIIHNILAKIETIWLDQYEGIVRKNRFWIGFVIPRRDIMDGGRKMRISLKWMEGKKKLKEPYIFEMDKKEHHCINWSGQRDIVWYRKQRFALSDWYKRFYFKNDSILYAVLIFSSV